MEDHTIVWDQKGVVCVKPCEGKTVRGVIHTLDREFLNKALMEHADVEMENCIDVDDKEGD